MFDFMIFHLSLMITSYKNQAKIGSFHANYVTRDYIQSKLLWNGLNEKWKFK
jgi:hypothetical protein